jgi:hypothetical protein
MVEVASMELGLEAVVVHLKVYDHRNEALMVLFEDLGYGPRLSKALGEAMQAVVLGERLQQG